MKTRALAAAAFLSILLPVATVDLSACGDKSLSAGGIRMQRAIAARFPASVLIFAPPGSALPSAMSELHLQENLSKVGHTYREVSSAAELQDSLASGRFNIVMANLGDVPHVQRQLDGSAPSAALVAVAPRLTKAEKAVAVRLSRFVITAASGAGEYLLTIADAVRSRGKGQQKA